MTVSKEDKPASCNRSCERCGKHFKCSPDDVATDQLQASIVDASTREFLSRTDWDCLCGTCIKEIAANLAHAKGKTFPRQGELKQDVHFYMENGLFVFTEFYHLLRGRCCRSGCRHCAYGFRKKL